MKNRGWGISSIKPTNYTTVLLGGWKYLCAFSGSSVSSLYATWAVPAGVVAPCGHHMYAGFSLSVCFFSLVHLLCWSVFCTCVSLLLYVGVWHSVPSAVLVAFP